MLSLTGISARLSLQLKLETKFPENRMFHLDSFKFRCVLRLSMKKKKCWDTNSYWVSKEVTVLSSRAFLCSSELLNLVIFFFVLDNSLEKSTGFYVVSQFDMSMSKYLVVVVSEYKTNETALAESFSSMLSVPPFLAFFPLPFLYIQRAVRFFISKCWLFHI